MSLPTAQIHQPPLGKEDDMGPVGERVPVHLRAMEKTGERKRPVTEKAPQPQQAALCTTVLLSCSLHNTFQAATHTLPLTAALLTNLGFNFFSVAIVFKPLCIHLTPKVANVA